MLISYHHKTFNYTPRSRSYRKHLHPTSTASVYVTSVTSWLNPSSWTSSRFHGTFSMDRLVIATGNFQRMLQILHYYWSFEGTRAVTWIRCTWKLWCTIFLSNFHFIEYSHCPLVWKRRVRPWTISRESKAWINSRLNGIAGASTSRRV